MAERKQAARLMTSGFGCEASISRGVGLSNSRVDAALLSLLQVRGMRDPRLIGVRHSWLPRLI